MTTKIQQGLVTTIIPVFNRPELIVEAVESVLNQTYQKTEIIIVNDGSTDTTLDVINQLAQKHSQITVLSQVNAGPGVARELGRQSAAGEFIQYLDSDDLLFPEKFEQQVAALNHDQACVAAYGKTQMGRIGEPLNGKAIRLTAEFQQAMFPAFLRSRWWGTSTPLYRRSELDKIGPWSGLINEEDWEYDCRLASLGGRLAYVDIFVSHARQHDQHLSAAGGTDPSKLEHRCLAQAQIFEHAQTYVRLEGRLTEIEAADWLFFSKAVFLLARQCAAAGLVEQTQAMLNLSIKAAGRPNFKHRLFSLTGHTIGWRGASRLVSWLNK